jgi:hypothetical protein
LAKRARSASKKKAKALARKRAPKKAARKPAKPAGPPTRIELRMVREFANRHIALIDAHPAPSPKAQEVKSRMQQWVADIEANCGADMTIPFA